MCKAFSDDNLTNNDYIELVYLILCWAMTIIGNKEAIRCQV